MPPSAPYNCWGNLCTYLPLMLTDCKNLSDNFDSLLSEFYNFYPLREARCHERLLIVTVTVLSSGEGNLGWQRTRLIDAED